MLVRRISLLGGAREREAMGSHLRQERAADAVQREHLREDIETSTFLDLKDSTRAFLYERSVERAKKRYKSVFAGKMEYF